MIKVVYRIFGKPTEFKMTIELKSLDDLRVLVSQHTTSSKAYLVNEELPDATISLTSNGVINTFIYNKGEAIINFLNNPKSIFDKMPDFPINLTDELKASLEEEKGD